MEKKDIRALHTLMALATAPGFRIGQLFGEILEPEEKYPYERLGGGYELRPIELTKKEAENSHIVNLQYSHLYHNGLKVSDGIFRTGGTGGEFKEGYCQLIHYVRDKKRESGFSFGTHVIINNLGEICLAGTGISSYPSHCGWNIGKLKDTYYDLTTGKEVLTCSSSGSINGKEYIIVEHQYDWYNKDLPLGIYKINKRTFVKLKKLMT